MDQRSGCEHNWVKHGDRSFFCSECGYFAETLEEWHALLNYEKGKIIKKVEKILDEINCEHKEKLKQKIHSME